MNEVFNRTDAPESPLAIFAHRLCRLKGSLLLENVKHNTLTGGHAADRKRAGQQEYQVHERHRRERAV